MAQRTKGAGIAGRLRQYMADHKLRITDLQKMLGYRSVDAVYKLLRYDIVPSKRPARVIAGLLDSSLDAVLLEFEDGARRRHRRAA